MICEYLAHILDVEYCGAPVFFHTLELTMKQFLKSEEEKLLEKAEDGDANAQFTLGCKYYFSGDRPKYSFTEARRWFKKAAGNNHPDAQYVLGLICSEENIEPHDLSEAENYFLEAAKLGHYEAQYELGKMYFLGKGVDRDIQEGIKWLEKAAAEQDNIKASLDLAEIYADGKGTRRSETNANLWRKRSCNLSVGEVLHCIALMYTVGEGVQRDVFKAYEIASFISVVDNKYEYLSDKLSAELDKEQVAEAEVLKDEYRRKFAGKKYLESQEFIIPKLEQFKKDMNQFKNSDDLP